MSKICAHYIIVNADLAPKDRSISPSSHCKKDMKKEGWSCCWENETRLYITTAGDLSALQLTTTAAPPSPSVSVCLRLSPSLPLSHVHSDFALGSSFIPAPLLYFSSHSFHVFINGSNRVLVFLAVRVLYVRVKPAEKIPLIQVFFSNTSLCFQILLVWYILAPLCAPLILPPFVSLLPKKTTLIAFLCLLLKLNTMLRLLPSNTSICLN